MAVTISTAPVYPTREALISFTLNGGGDFVKLLVTDAPIGSELKSRLDKTGASKLEVFKGSAADKFRLKVERGGKYVFSAEEYTKGAAGYGGGYSTDPNAFQTETQISTSTVSVTFGDPYTAPAGTQRDPATIRFWCWGDYIRATTADIHGEVTPALVDTSTERAVMAASTSDVVTALAALDGQTSTLAIGTLSTVFENMRGKIRSHFGNSGSHSSTDTDNQPSTDNANANGPGLVAAVADLSQKLYRHMTNDAAGAGVHSGAYHSPVDWEHVPVIAPPGSIDTLMLAMADIWRAYELHRADASVHTAPDVTYTLSALPTLLDAQKEVLTVLADPAPTAPATMNEFSTAALAAGLKRG